ncbi:hypothetical protein OH687_19085 [Burkholderia anthina]|nr:hypothetical protein OH687_19085 [Burkholderia anthina]
MPAGIDAAVSQVRAMRCNRCRVTHGDRRVPDGAAGVAHRAS